MTPSPARWRAVWPPAEIPVGPDVHTTVVEGSVHIFAGRPSADGVSHVVVDPDGTCRALPGLPLCAVSGAATGPDGPVVAGASIDDQAPVVQPWAAPPMRLPDRGPVAAWPIPVGGRPIRVVWATGQRPATVWLETLSPAGPTAESVLTADAVLGLRAVGRPGGVDLLCDTDPGGPRFVRVGAGPSVERSVPPGSFLSPGALLTPHDREVDIWSPDTDTHRTIRLPSPGRRVRISRITLSNGHWLTWTTEDVDEPGGGDSRGWLARLDAATGSLTEPTPLPAPGRPAAVHFLGRKILVVQPAAGFLQIWTNDDRQDGHH